MCCRAIKTKVIEGAVIAYQLPTPVQVFVAFIDHVSTARLKSCKDGRTDGSSKTRKE